MRAFNRWLEEDWGYGTEGRIYGAPLISLVDIEQGIVELDRLIAGGARFVCLMAGPIEGRSPGDPCFDPFWARCQEARVNVVFHIGSTSVSAAYNTPWGLRPTPPSHRHLLMEYALSFTERPVVDQITALIADNVFGRCPARVLSVEYGSYLVAPFDIIHSGPRIMDYLDSTGKTTYRFIAVGANDGMLHVFTDSKVNFGGTTYQAGDEIFAFIPGDLLGNLQEFSKPESHVYMVDGSPVLYRSRTKSDGTNYDMMLVFGERSGGRSYWALDISKPNPAEWKVKWHIDGGDLTTGFEELGYTWSKPYFARLKTGDTTTKEVVIFAGGYDLIEDKFPKNLEFILR